MGITRLRTEDSDSDGEVITSWDWDPYQEKSLRFAVHSVAWTPPKLSYFLNYDGINDIRERYLSLGFHDLRVQTRGDELPAHKAVLAASSDVFRQMFESGQGTSH